MIGAFAASLRRYSPLWMVASIALGLAVPQLAAILRGWVVPISVVMVPLSVMRIDMGELGRAFRPAWRVTAAAFVVLVVLPILTGIVGLILGLPGWLITGLVLIAAAPPLSSSAAFAILLRIDPARVTAVSLMATAAAPATMWLVTKALPGFGQGIDATALILRLAIFIGGAFAAAFVVRRILGKERIDRAAPAIDSTTIFLVMCIGVGVMHEIGQTLRADPLLWLALFGATWLLSVLSCASAVGLFWRGSREAALATGVVAAVKNIALMVAAIAPVVEPRVLLVVMTAQLPIFFAPLVLRPVFQRISATAPAASKSPR
ncbi:hypothetical protein [Flavimaricola marinus]|uniref:Sodium Bile acid symporter family protein n=1 Tax=Flavimaricola marinus TaxID=1819565 RepID=A0A238LGS1_9RHOB|nr:hypothetical protein [Flavimaricola marinus]SMY08156.1 hypothetical protein LOM8899_02305 [Flavimaricola marinus]